MSDENIGIALPWRVQSLETRHDRFEGDVTRKFDNFADRKADRSEVQEVKEEIRGLRRVIIGAAVTMAVSSISFAFTIFAVIQPG